MYRMIYNHRLDEYGANDRWDIGGLCQPFCPFDIHKLIKNKLTENNLENYMQELIELVGSDHFN